MILELHVLGPGFSLPSIDPECLATILYFSQVVPQGEWLLVQNTSLALDHYHALPLLKYGTRRISGFRGIVRFLRQHSSGTWDLDADLDEDQSATATAVSAFLETNGRPLIDLSLFASSQNYNAVTRPLLSSSHAPWGFGLSVSRRLRNEARLRSAHLDISYLDVDDGSAVREADTSTSRDLTSLLPRVLNMTSVEQAQQAQRIRLDALICSFLEPLQNLLGSNTSLLSKSGPSSVDCVAFGYLALAYRPELPQSWLRDRIRSSFAPLARYVESLQPLLPGASAAPNNEIDDSRALEHPQVPESGEPQRPSRILLALGSALRAMPLINSYLIDARFAKAFTDASSANKPAATALSANSLVDAKPLGLVTITVGLCLTWLLLAGSSASILPRRGRPNQADLKGLGQAGATLASLPRLPSGASAL